MNEALKDLIEPEGYSCVPLIAHYPNLYELVNANYEWMLGGFGEGIVIVSLDEVNSSVRKWKNGVESRDQNAKVLNNLMDEIQSSP